MTSADVMAAACIPVVRAAVTAGAVETVYWRAGAGPTVILLRASRCDDDLLAAQVVRLAARVRVIVPEMVSAAALCGASANAHGSSAFAAWLRDFVEGLGICGAHIVGTEEFASQLHALAQDPDELFGCLLCIGRHTADISASPAASETIGATVAYFTAEDSWPDAVVQHIHATTQRHR